LCRFLADLFHEGLQYRTISGNRSLLSAILPPVGDTPVGQHAHIVRILRGVFNKRPTVARLVLEWDLQVVLKALQEYPFEPMSKTSLKFVAIKTGITTFRRVGDLHALRLGEGAVSVQNQGVTFLIQGPSKTGRPSHISPKIFVPCFKNKKLLGPKRAITWY